MPRISILQLPDKIYEFDEGTLCIGRDDDCDIFIPMGSVSRKHASLSHTESGWLLRDMNSHNGVFVNGERVQSALLTTSTVFRVGAVDLCFQLDLSEEDLAANRGCASDFCSELALLCYDERGFCRDLLMTLLAGGNALVYAPRGYELGSVAQGMAQILGVTYGGVSMEQDSLPEDILGTVFTCYDKSEGEVLLKFSRGPLFNGVVYVGTMDKAPRRTCAAVLDAFANRKVRAAEQEHELPAHQFMLATYSSMEELDRCGELGDRFTTCLSLPYPSEREELFSANGVADCRTMKPVLPLQKLQSLKELLADYPIGDKVIRYATDIVRKTRPNNPDAPDFIRQAVKTGAGPSSLQALVSCAKARAMIDGHGAVKFDDVRGCALAVLRHRLTLKAETAMMAEDVVRRLLVAIAEPQ